jgi:hypothetical protein
VIQWGSSSGRQGRSSGEETVPEGRAVQPPTYTASSSSSSSAGRSALEVYAVGGAAAADSLSETAAGSAATMYNDSRPDSSVSPEPPQPVTPASKPSVVTRAMKPGKECVVCMEARCCVLQLPCRHLCFCEACMELLRGKSQECPMCRTQVTEYVVL